MNKTEEEKLKELYAKSTKEQLIDDIIQLSQNQLPPPKGRGLRKGI